MSKPVMIGTMFPKFTATFFTEDSKGKRTVIAQVDDFPNPIYNKCLELKDSQSVIKIAAWHIELAADKIESKCKNKGICTVAEYIHYRETKYRG